MKIVRLLIYINLTIISFHVAAQSFHGGIMAGLAGSQVAGDTYSGYDKAGVFAGAFVSWDFTRRSALQLELEYFQKGSRKNPDAENNDYESYLFRTNYVEIPLLYQFTIDWFTIQAGPSAGFLFGFHEVKNSEDLTYQPDYNTPARVTLQINLGVRFHITSKIGVDFRTNNSLLNIRSQNRPGDVWRFWGYGQFHDALVLSLFYQFR